MSDTHTMTLNMPQGEAAVLTQLAFEKGMTKTAVLRQALRIYQLIQRADHVDIRLGTESLMLRSSTKILL